MLKFKVLDLEDRFTILNHLPEYRFKTYEYSFLTLYLWKDYCNVEYGILDNAVIIKKNGDETGPYFMQPIDYAAQDLAEIVAELLRIRRSDPSFRCLFRDVEKPFLLELKKRYGANLSYAEDVKNFDYIYETRKLIDLTGEKLTKRKNQYHQFLNRYDYALKDIHDESVIRDCLDLAEAWYGKQSVKSTELFFELRGINNVLAHLDVLNAIGMAVYVNDRLAGFTVGEKASREMAIIHIEKGDTKYKGIYAFINKVFAENYLQGTQYINREEDLGLAGLRKAKLAYDPLKLEKKYIVDIAP